MSNYKKWLKWKSDTTFILKKPALIHEFVSEIFFWFMVFEKWIFSLSILYYVEVFFCKKVKVNNKILWNWVCLMFLLGFGKLLSILRFTQFLYIQLAIFAISFIKSPFLAKLVAWNVFSIQFWPMNLDFHPELIKCKKHRIFQNFRFRP